MALLPEEEYLLESCRLGLAGASTTAPALCRANLPALVLHIPRRFLLLRPAFKSMMGYLSSREVPMERKYRQRGYLETDKAEKKKDRPAEGRARQEQIGPRTPRMVGSVTRARCANCGNVLLPGFDPKSQCPRCQFELHCCKQCVHFDTGARFECTQPIPEHIPKKDARNDCTFYAFRTTVEKDTAPSAPFKGPPSAVAPAASAVRSGDARKAFEDLFKK